MMVTRIWTALVVLFMLSTTQRLSFSDFHGLVMSSRNWESSSPSTLQSLQLGVEVPNASRIGVMCKEVREASYAMCRFFAKVDWHC